MKLRSHRLNAAALVLALGLLVTGCLGGRVPKPSTPTLPELVVIEGRDDEFAATCAAIYQSELGRPIDATGAAACLERARCGETGAQLVEWVRTASPEYAERQARLERARLEAEAREKQEQEEREKNRPRLRGRLKATGTRLVDASGADFHVVFASGLALLSRTPAQRAAFLDEVAGLGFNGVRVFGGRLTWANQTPDSAIGALPALLQETAARGLYLQLAAITDSAEGYDPIAHLKRVAVMTAAAEHVVLEVANEPWHPSQGAVVRDLPRLCDASKRALAGYPNVWMLGAPQQSNPINGKYDGICGPITTAHLDRSGGPADILAAVFGLVDIMELAGTPVISGEPIGAAEATVRSRRLAVPAFFGDLAQYLVSLGLAGGVFHSEDGLNARPLGARQLAAARAYVDGSQRAPITIPRPRSSDPCDASNIDTPKEIVACEREKYPAGHLSKPQLADLTRAISRRLNAKGIDGGPFGVLVKKSGNNCNNYSCDIVCTGNGAEQRQFDVLIDENEPTWRQVSGTIRIDVCEVVR